MQEGVYSKLILGVVRQALRETPNAQSQRWSEAVCCSEAVRLLTNHFQFLHNLFVLCKILIMGLYIRKRFLC